MCSGVTVTGIGPTGKGICVYGPRGRQSDSRKFSKNPMCVAGPQRGSSWPATSRASGPLTASTSGALQVHSGMAPPVRGAAPTLNEAKTPQHDLVHPARVAPSIQNAFVSPPTVSLRQPGPENRSGYAGLPPRPANAFVSACSGLPPRPVNALVSAVPAVPVAPAVPHRVVRDAASVDAARRQEAEDMIAHQRQEWEALRADARRCKARYLEAAARVQASCLAKLEDVTRLVQEASKRVVELRARENIEMADDALEELASGALATTIAARVAKARRELEGCAVVARV